MLVSLGRFRGVGEICGIEVSGFLAWFLWRSYYLLPAPQPRTARACSTRLGAGTLP